MVVTAVVVVVTLAAEEQAEELEDVGEDKVDRYGRQKPIGAQGNVDTGDNGNTPTWDPGHDFSHSDCIQMSAECSLSGGAGSSWPSIPYCHCVDSGTTFQWTPVLWCEDQWEQIDWGYYGDASWDGIVETEWHDLLNHLFGNAWDNWGSALGQWDFALNCAQTAQDLWGSYFGEEQPVLHCSFDITGCMNVLSGGEQTGTYGGRGFGGRRTGGRIKRRRRK